MHQHKPTKTKYPEIIEVEETGLRPGMLNLVPEETLETQLPIKTASINPGTKILMFCDSVGQYLDDKTPANRKKKIIYELLRNKQPASIIKSINMDAHKNLSGKNIGDDYTILSLKIK